LEQEEAILRVEQVLFQVSQRPLVEQEELVLVRVVVTPTTVVEVVEQLPEVVVQALEEMVNQVRMELPMEEMVALAL
tara:strand:+ start:173 stop:403 length:231 start_codon:yes stop_codon:yes gene_type:complete